jgi:hypothetical protein
MEPLQKLPSGNIHQFVVMATGLDELQAETTNNDNGPTAISVAASPHISFSTDVAVTLPA